MKYIDQLLFKLTSWIMGDVFAQEVYGPPDYNGWNQNPVPKYGIVPTTDDLSHILWYFAGGILLVVAIIVVLWYRFNKKKNAKKDSKTSSSKDI